MTSHLQHIPPQHSLQRGRARPAWRCCTQQVGLRQGGWSCCPLARGHWLTGLQQLLQPARKAGRRLPHAVLRERPLPRTTSPLPIRGSPSVCSAAPGRATAPRSLRRLSADGPRWSRPQPSSPRSKQYGRSGHVRRALAAPRRWYAASSSTRSCGAGSQRGQRAPRQQRQRGATAPAAAAAGGGLRTWHACGGGNADHSHQPAVGTRQLHPAQRGARRRRVCGALSASNAAGGCCQVVWAGIVKVQTCCGRRSCQHSKDARAALGRVAPLRRGAAVPLPSGCAALTLNSHAALVQATNVQCQCVATPASTSRWLFTGLSSRCQGQVARQPAFRRRLRLPPLPCFSGTHRTTPRLLSPPPPRQVDDLSSVLRPDSWCGQYSGTASFVQVKGLRPGRSYAVRVTAVPHVSNLPDAVVVPSPPSETVVVATLPCPPMGQPSPQLATRLKKELKVGVGRVG